MLFGELLSDRPSPDEEGEAESSDSGYSWNDVSLEGDIFFSPDFMLFVVYVFLVLLLLVDEIDDKNCRFFNFLSISPKQFFFEDAQCFLRLFIDFHF